MAFVNPVTQRIPEGAAFPELRDSLARTGGQLLVSVMRDMLEGKVCVCAIDQPLPRVRSL